MADIFLDPRLPDYFDEVDVASPNAGDALASFLASRLVILRGVDLSGVDLPFLQKIVFPQTWEMKKFQFGAFVRSYRLRGEGAPLFGEILTACGGDKARVRQLVEQFERIHRLVDTLLASTLPGVKIDQTGYVARFSETRMENLHFDVDANSDDHDAVRLYINIDSAPRIWATSHQMTSLAKRVAGQIDAQRYRDRPLERFVQQLNARAFGGWHNRADERRSPRHFVYFEPGDVWMVDGRTLSHQVLFGQRVISIYAPLRYDANEHLHPSFAEKARLAIKSAAAPPRPGAKPFKVLGPSPSAGDMKGDWAKMFGKPERGRVRRFTGQGMVSSDADRE